MIMFHNQIDLNFVHIAWLLIALKQLIVRLF